MRCWKGVRSTKNQVPNFFWLQHHLVSCWLIFHILGSCHIVLASGCTVPAMKQDPPATCPACSKGGPKSALRKPA